MSKHPDFGGLAAKLFDDDSKERQTPHPVEQLTAAVSPTRIILLPVNEVRPDPNQPRQHFDETSLAELTDSVRENGILQPVIARQNPDGAGCTLIAGERRWRAAKAAGLEKIPALLRESENVREIALIENLQRENLHPVDEAEALAALKAERGYTDEILAKVIGKSRSSITETLSLATLPTEIRTDCRTSDKCSKSLLLEVLRAGDAIKQQTVWDAVKDGKLSTVRAVRSVAKPGKARPKRFQFAYKPEDKSFQLTVTFPETTASVERVRSALKAALASLTEDER